MKPRSKWLVLSSFIVLNALFLVYLKEKTASQMHWLNAVGPKLEMHLGFKYGSPYVNGEEMLLIEQIVPGGVMEAAGLEIGDVPYDMGMDEFYQILWDGRGKIVEVEMVNAYDDPPLSSSNKKILHIPVPQLN